jgi:hypothetical protein
MTTAERADDLDTAIVDGIDVDAVASAVRACRGLSDLVDGPFGDATSYLPGRRVAGIAIKTDAVRVSVRAKWGVPASELLDQIAAALLPYVAGRRIELVVADIDDPPSSASPEPVTVPPGSDASVPAGPETTGSNHLPTASLVPAPRPFP